MTMKEKLLQCESVDEMSELVYTVLEDYDKEIKDHCVASYSLNGVYAIDYNGLRELESKSWEMDCGWLKWSFKDPDLNKHLINLWYKKYGKDYYSSEFTMYVVPFQSTRLQSYAGDLAKEILIRDFGLELNYRIHLD